MVGVETLKGLRRGLPGGLAEGGGEDAQSVPEGSAIGGPEAPSFQEMQKSACGGEGSVL